MNPEAARKERDRILGIGLGLTTTVSETIQNYRTLVLDYQKSGWQLEPYLKDLQKHLGHKKLPTVKKAEYVTLVQKYGKERGIRSSAIEHRKEKTRATRMATTRRTMPVKISKQNPRRSISRLACV